MKWLKGISQRFLLFLIIMTVILSTWEYITDKTSTKKEFNERDLEIKNLKEHVIPIFSSLIEKKIPKIIEFANQGNCEEIDNLTQDPYVTLETLKEVKIYYSFCLFKLGKVDEAIETLENIRYKYPDDFKINVYLYFYNMIRINEITDYTFPQLTGLDRSSITKNETDKVEYNINKNIVYLRSISRVLNKTNLDEVYFKQIGTPINVRQLFMRLHNIQVIPLYGDKEFLEFLEKILERDLIDFQVALCKYSFTEKQLCQFNNGGMSFSCSNETSIIDETICWNVLESLNYTANTSIFDVSGRGYVIYDLLKNLAEHHFMQCTGFNYQELSQRNPNSFSIKNESECKIALNITNLKEDLKIMRDDILEMLYKYHFYQCTGYTLIDFTFKIRKEGSADIPNVSECRSSLFYVNELVNKSRWGWSYKDGRDTTASIVEYFDSKK